MTFPPTGETGIVDDSFIALAEKLANAARLISLRHFRSSLTIEDKADDSPVTIADREAEAAMRGIIEESFPDHGIFGEEFGKVRSDAEYIWVLDPIDGTQPFVTGIPLFGTLIALVHRGKPVVGVLDCPALNERWVGVEGRPTTYNGQPAGVRACEELNRAWLLATSPHMFPGDDFEAFERLRKKTRRGRAVYGGECYAYGLLANGSVDLVVEATMQPYDYLAHVPVINGAGGIITDWQGEPLNLNSDGRVLAAGDARMHKVALEVLAGCEDT